MRFAFADPPYLGLAKTFYGHLHPDAADYDKPETHAALIERLSTEYDGWALCLHSPSLRTILPMCPDDVRVMAWVKPWASFKPGVNPGYTWEPVIVRGGRKRQRGEETVRDWVAANIAMQKGLRGAKPMEFCVWVLSVLNARPGDVVDDIFPGTGVMGRAAQLVLADLGEQSELFTPTPRGSAP